MIRGLLAGLLFAFALFGPLYLACVVAIALSLRWGSWEVIAAGLLIDFLYMGSFWHHIPYVTTLGALVLVTSLYPFRRELMATAGDSL